MYRTSGKDGLDFEVSFMFIHIGFLLSFVCMDSFLFCLFVWLKPTVPWILTCFCGVSACNNINISSLCHAKVESKVRKRLKSCLVVMVEGRPHSSMGCIPTQIASTTLGLCSYSLLTIFPLNIFPHLSAA